MKFILGIDDFFESYKKIIKNAYKSADPDQRKKEIQKQRNSVKSKTKHKYYEKGKKGRTNYYDKYKKGSNYYKEKSNKNKYYGNDHKGGSSNYFN